MASLADSSDDLRTADGIHFTSDEPLVPDLVESIADIATTVIPSPKSVLEVSAEITLATDVVATVVEATNAPITTVDLTADVSIPQPTAGREVRKTKDGRSIQLDYRLQGAPESHRNLFLDIDIKGMKTLTSLSFENTLSVGDVFTTVEVEYLVTMLLVTSCSSNISGPVVVYAVSSIALNAVIEELRYSYDKKNLGSTMVVSIAKETMDLILGLVNKLDIVHVAITDDILFNRRVESRGMMDGNTTLSEAATQENWFVYLLMVAYINSDRFREKENEFECMWQDDVHLTTLPSVSAAAAVAQRSSTRTKKSSTAVVEQLTVISVAVKIVFLKINNILL